MAVFPFNRAGVSCPRAVRAVPLSARLRAILESYPEREGFILYPEYPEKDGTETKYRVDFTETFRTLVVKAGLRRTP